MNFFLFKSHQNSGLLRNYFNLKLHPSFSHWSLAGPFYVVLTTYLAKYLPGSFYFGVFLSSGKIAGVIGYQVIPMMLCAIKPDAPTCLSHLEAEDSNDAFYDVASIRKTEVELTLIGINNDDLSSRISSANHKVNLQNSSIPNTKSFISKEEHHPINMHTLDLNHTLFAIFGTLAGCGIVSFLLMLILRWIDQNNERRLRINRADNEEDGISIQLSLRSHTISASRQSISPNNKKALLLQSFKTFCDISVYKRITRKTWTLMYIYIVFYATIRAVNYTISGYMKRLWKIDLDTVSNIASLESILAVFLCPLIGKLIDKYGHQKYWFLTSGILLISSYSSWYYFQVDLPCSNKTGMSKILAIIMTVQSISYIIIASGVASYISRTNEPDLVPSVLGIMFGINSMFTALCAWITGYFIDEFGDRCLPKVVAVFSIFVLIGNFVLLQVDKDDKDKIVSLDFQDDEDDDDENDSIFGLHVDPQVPTNPSLLSEFKDELYPLKPIIKPNTTSRIKSSNLPDTQHKVKICLTDEMSRSIEGETDSSILQVSEELSRTVLSRGNSKDCEERRLNV